MLKPREIEALPLAMVELYSELEEEILADMARRIAGFDTWIASADWQYRKMVEAGNFHSYIVEALAARTGKSSRDLERLMQEAGAKSLAFDTAIYREAGLTPPPLAESAALRKALTAGYKATNKTMQNLTRSTAATATSQLENALDLAWLQIHSGAFSPEVAVQSAIKRLAKEGVQSIRYPSGHTDSLEVAVRRATLTGVNQTCLQMQLALAEDLGSDLVETTAHAGARPSHAAWQGKIFSLSGKSRRYPDFRAVTGYGTGAGLGGWNCSHSFCPYFEGAPRTYSQDLLGDYTAKKYQYQGQKLSEYEALQEQRSIERNIRRWKREFAAMDAVGLDKTQAAAKLTEWQGKQSAFLQETGLKRQAGREKLAGWGRSEAARARAAHEAQQRKAEGLKTLSESGIIGKTGGYTVAKYKRLLENATSVQLGGGVSSLPASGVANSIADLKRADGTVKQRRIYGANGLAMVDYDADAHGKPKYHPTGAHKHIYDHSKNDPHGSAAKLTQTDLDSNADIIKEGVNYHAPKTE